MAKKRKTLVDDFEEIINSGDLEAFKKVFDKCEINACRGRGSKCNALSFKGLTPDHIKFLIENGIDINADCGYGETAVAFQANNIDNLKCLLENGADINKALSFNGNALFISSRHHDVEAVRNLLECGADVDSVCESWNRTPLEENLECCVNADIVKALKISKLLLEAGATKTKKTKEAVYKIGERFEFYRESFNKDSLEEFDAALMELYQLFEVEPVPKRMIYDGKSKITVKSKTWQKQQGELWDMLVPGSGHANTVQGELIRIVGKVTYEILDNGAMNWDLEYRKLVKAMIEYFEMADGMEEALTAEACSIAKGVSAKSDEKTLYRLTELTVKWVLANPEPLELEKVEYKR